MNCAKIKALNVTKNGPESEVEQTVVLQDDGCPAVIVEEVPSAQVESECYSAQVVVYGDETYLMQDVADEQEVITEVTETGHLSHSGRLFYHKLR
uniref:Transcription factor Elf N-terminal domain-containing protein n=1 Tax=Neogobius melanostomus TaxID=47308 RepID=A0A8C6SH83_9GOBI